MRESNEIVSRALSNRGRNGFDDTKEGFNPYRDINAAQRRCKHRWENETDAIYIGPKGERICAICHKKL